MKIRIASSIALAAALALGATGCSLIAPVATKTPYAPSDGVDVDVAGVAVRNIMLIADESGENFNVVFTGVNNGAGAEDLTITFVTEGGQQASADFPVDSGSTLFGAPDGDEEPTLVSLRDVAPGDTVTAFFSTPGGPEVEYMVPVLDGTLSEYQDFVLDVSVIEAAEEEAAQGSEDAQGAEGSQGDATGTGASAE